MEKTITFDSVMDEIKQIPDHKLPELYELVHGFRLRLPGSEKEKQQIMQFAGSWIDLPDEDFTSFLTETRQRRKQAFSGRRGDYESDADRH